MAAKSNSLPDILYWLCDILSSCKTEEQQESAKWLILLYVNNLFHNSPIRNGNGYTDEALFLFSVVKPVTDGMWISMKYPYISEHIIDWNIFGGLKEF